MGQSQQVAPSLGGQNGRKQAPSTELAQRQNQPPAKAENQGVAGTLKSWWNKGTSWMGEKYNQASEAVSGAYDATKKTLGDFSDIVQNSSVSMKDGKFSASTDMDEVMDVLPESVRKQMTMDKSNPAANQATLEVDTHTGKLSLKVPNLMLSSLNMGGVTAGKTSLRGVVITMDNAGALAHDYAAKKVGNTVADLAFGKGKGGPIDTNTTLKVASVLANDVAYAQGGISAKQLELSGLNVSIFNKGGGLPAADDKPDQLRMDFSVDSAVVRGLKSPGAEASDLGVTGVKGNLDQTTETADLSVKAMQAGKLNAGGQQLGSGQIQDLSTHIDNKGGGLPFLDKTPDHLSVQGHVGDVAASGVNSSALKADKAHAAGIDFSHGTGGDSVKAASVSGSGIQAGGVGISTVKAEKIAASTGASGSHLSLGSAHAAGVEGNGLKVADAKLAGLEAGKSGEHLSGSAGSLDLAGLSSGAGSANAVHGSKLAFDHDGGHDRVDAASLNASGIKAGGATVKQAGVSGLHVDKNGSAVVVDAAGANAQGLQHAGGSVGSATASGLHLNHGASGDSGSLKTLDASGIQAAGTSVGKLTVQGASAQLAADHKSGSAKIGAVTADTVTGAASVDHADGSGVAAQFGPNGVRGSVDTLHANKLNVGGNQVGSLTGTGIQGAKNGDQLSASVGTVNATQIQAGGTQVGNLAAANLQGAKNGDQLQGSAGHLEASQIANSYAKLGSVSVDGLSGSQGGGKTAVSLDRAAASGVDTKTLKVGEAGLQGFSGSADQNNSSGSVSLRSGSARNVSGSFGTLQSGSVENLKAQGNNVGGGQAFVDGKADHLKGSATVGGVNLSGLKTDSLSVGSAQLSGASAEVDGNQKKGAVANAHVSDLQAKAGGMQVGVRDLSGSNLSASNTAGPSHASPGLTTSPAALAGLIDNADLSAQIPLNAGKYDHIGVKPNTQADIHASVQHGKLDPRNTRATINNPLDAPLWISVKGAYLDPKDADHAKLRADLGGWSDMNVSDKLPGGKDSIPLNLSDLAKQVAPATPAPKATGPAPSSGAPVSAHAGSLSASGISVSGKLPDAAPTKTAVTDPKNPANIPDLAHAKVQGSVGLKSGKADLGSVKADLLKEDAHDNTANIKADGAQNLAVEFTRLLVGSFSTSVGGADVSAGKSSVGGGNLQVKAGQGSKDVKGSIGSVKVENLNASRP